MTIICLSAQPPVQPSLCPPQQPAHPITNQQPKSQTILPIIWRRHSAPSLHQAHALTRPIHQPSSPSNTPAYLPSRPPSNPPNTQLPASSQLILLPVQSIRRNPHNKPFCQSSNQSSQSFTHHLSHPTPSPTSNPCHSPTCPSYGDVSQLPAS